MTKDDITEFMSKVTDLERRRILLELKERRLEPDAQDSSYPCEYYVDWKDVEYVLTHTKYD
jgi:hypothetical protein